MENTLMLFQYQKQSVRTVRGENGDVWFVAKDVCECLDVTWSGGKILAKIPDRWKQTREIYDSNGRMQMMICVNEPAMYKLAFRSNKPEAEAFTNWVAEDVLPTLRKTGTYELPEDMRRRMQIMEERCDVGAETFKALQQVIKLQEHELRQVKQENKRLWQEKQAEQ